VSPIIPVHSVTTLPGLYQGFHYGSASGAAAVAYQTTSWWQHAKNIGKADVEWSGLFDLKALLIDNGGPTSFEGKGVGRMWEDWLFRAQIKAEAGAMTGLSAGAKQIRLARLAGIAVRGGFFEATAAVAAAGSATQAIWELFHW
jgi:hypothetical protein